MFHNHLWPPFVGGKGKTVTLEKGNYEWPFEVELPGNFCESVEGMPEASITYHLKATVARGKLAYDLHAKKRLRVIRTLESSALEFLHAMSVENIWPNKVEYSIVVPQKAVIFGTSIPLETRFTPLLKGLEIGDITCKLMETHEILLTTPQGVQIREHKREREVKQWTLSVNRDDHWNDLIEDSGQEGWVLSSQLDLPKKLGQCMQDTNVHGIKIRHKLKLVVALHNPDGHVSEVSCLGARQPKMVQTNLCAASCHTTCNGIHLPQHAARRGREPCATVALRFQPRHPSTTHGRHCPARVRRARPGSTVRRCRHERATKRDANPGHTVWYQHSILCTV